MNPLLFVFIILISGCYTCKAQDVAQLDKQLQKSIVAFDKEQFIKAERLLNKLIAQEELYAPAYFWKGKCLEEFEEYLLAYDAYYTATQLQPQVAQYWLALGDFKQRLGSLSIQKPEACGECGRQFLPNVGGRPEASSYFKSALVDYQKAIELDSTLAAAHYQLGLTQAALGAKEKACTSIHNAVELGYEAAVSYQKEYCSKKE
jgi:tetratricopeptide (TPR) repeat protein